MGVTLLTIVKVTKHKSKPFDHTVSISKWPAGSAYVGNIIFYLIYLSALFPRGIKVDLEGGNIFPILMLSMYMDKLSLFCHL